MIHITPSMSSTTECVQWCGGQFWQSCDYLHFTLWIKDSAQGGFKDMEPWTTLLSGKASEDACQSVCVTPLYHHHPSIKKYPLRALVHIHQSVSVAAVWRQMETSGTVLGVSPWNPNPPPHFSLPSCPLSLLHPAATFVLTKQKEQSQHYAGRPQNLAAGNGSRR